MCINVNLSPADLPKNGTMFDLPVAVGIMIALGKLEQEAVEGTLLLAAPDVIVLSKHVSSFFIFPLTPYYCPVFEFLRRNARMSEIRMTGKSR